MKLKDLTEDISIDTRDPSKLVVAVSRDTKHRASGPDFISTAKPPGLKTAAGQDVGGTKVYSAFTYKTGEQSMDMLRSLKGRGTFKVNPASLEAFIEDTADYASKLLRSKYNEDPTLIIFPKSSSDLNRKFVKALAENFPDARVMDDAFTKKVMKLSGDPKKDLLAISDLIDTAHEDFGKYSTKDVAALEKRLLTLVQREEGEVPLKDILPRFRKLLKGFLNIEPMAGKMLGGQRVLIVDDILSSGATFREMARLVNERGAESVVGFTIFKHD